ncbi:MAG: hypothetical protein KC503_47440 [Myxococcales bacterium]|nr:hypothetical protein [Myxococcales bacterium]
MPRAILSALMSLFLLVSMTACEPDDAGDANGAGNSASSAGKGPLGCCTYHYKSSYFDVTTGGSTHEGDEAKTLTEAECKALSGDISAEGDWGHTLSISNRKWELTACFSEGVIGKRCSHDDVCAGADCVLFEPGRGFCSYPCRGETLRYDRLYSKPYWWGATYPDSAFTDGDFYVASGCVLPTRSGVSHMAPLCTLDAPADKAIKCPDNLVCGQDVGTDGAFRLGLCTPR